MYGAHFFNNRGGTMFRSVQPDDLLEPAKAETTYHRMLHQALGEGALRALKETYAGCPALAEACDASKHS